MTTAISPAPRKMGEREQLILMALAESGPQTVKNLADLVGITPAQTYFSIYILEAAGKTERTGEFPARCFIPGRNLPAAELPPIGSVVTTIHDEAVTVVGHTAKKVKVRHPGGGTSARYPQHLRNEPAPAVVAPPMSERVSNWPNTGVSKRVGNEVLVSCSDCGEQRRFGGRMPANHVRINCERDGWTIDKKWKKARCPGCAEKDEQMNQQITAAAKRPSLRVLMSLLEEHYSTDTHQYDPGWSDEKVAQDADCSPTYVAELREREFGPLEDPRIADMRGAIVKAKADAKADADSIRALLADSERKWSARIDELGQKLVALQKPK